MSPSSIVAETITNAWLRIASGSAGASGSRMNRIADVTSSAPEVGQLLVDSCGWSIADYRDWLERTLVDAVLPAS